MTELRKITHIKGRDIYIFRYLPGRETELLNNLAKKTVDPNLNFDWFDAATISYQVGRISDEEQDSQRKRA
jgi:hypothetical protein